MAKTQKHILSFVLKNKNNKPTQATLQSIYALKRIIIMTNTTSAAANALRDEDLLVDFPTRRRPKATVRFDSSVTVHPVRSTLTMIGQKEELWYSRRDEVAMKRQRRIDATNLRRTLLTSTAEDLDDGGVHGSQVAGLEKAVDPAQARNIMRKTVQHGMAILQLQDHMSDEELCFVSQMSSRWSCEKAHKVAKTLIAMDR